MPQDKKRTKEPGAQKEAKRSQKGSKKKKDPNAPKKPLSAFFIFLNDKRAKYTKEHPDTKLTEVTKALSEVWKAMSPDQKKTYDDKAASDKKRYEQEMKNYTPPDADSDDEPAPKKKKAQKDANAPKRALSAYMLYSIDHGPKIREQNKGDAKGAMAKIAEAWKSADKATKEKYEKLAEAEKKRYQKEAADYKKGKGAAKAKPAEDEEEESGDDDDDAEEDEEEQEPAPKKKKMVADDDESDDE